MYQTTLTPSFLKELRSNGFVHITGLRGKHGSIHFHRKLWGKWYKDGMGVSIVITTTGEVWLRYNMHDDNFVPMSEEPQGDLEELIQAPSFFHTSEFISTQKPSWLLIRAADPYFDFSGSCVPDPRHY